MRLITLLYWALLIPVYGQNEYNWSFASSYNSKLYSELSDQYIEFQNAFKRSTLVMKSFDVATRRIVFITPKSNFSAGIAFNLRSMRINRFYDSTRNLSTNKKDPIQFDRMITSYAFGLSLKYKRNIGKSFFLNLVYNTYFLNFKSSSFFGRGDVFRHKANKHNDTENTIYPNKYSNYYLPNLNMWNRTLTNRISSYGNLEFQFGYTIPTKRRNLSVSANLGTTLYTNWDNFKNFTWYGFEYGFGRVNEKAAKVE